MPRTISATTLTPKYAIDEPRSSRPATNEAMILEMNITKEFMTPCSRVMVTMSPLATWDIS